MISTKLLYAGTVMTSFDYAITPICDNWFKTNLLYAGTVMMSFDYAITPICDNWFKTNLLYAGTVMMSFDYAITPICDNWFKTNLPKHELDDRVGNIVTSVYATSEKNMVFQQQILSKFVTVLWFNKNKLTDKTRILVLVRVL